MSSPASRAAAEPSRWASTCSSSTSSTSLSGFIGLEPRSGTEKLGRSQIGLMKHAEEPQEDDDRDRDSDKPQKNAAHDFTSISNVFETSAG